MYFLFTLKYNVPEKYLTKLMHEVKLKWLVFKITKADSIFLVAARIFKKLTKRQ